MYKVLLVDDERVIMEGIQKIIKGFDLGFGEIRIAEDGQDALEMLEQFEPDMIITDIRMVYMDGLTLCERIRQRKDLLRDIPIVVISGFSEFNYARTAIKYDVFAYLLKPIDKRELYDALVKIKEQLQNNNLSSSKHNTLNEELLFTLLSNKELSIEQADKLIKSSGLSVERYSKYYLLAAYDRNNRGYALEAVQSVDYREILIKLAASLRERSMDLLCSLDIEKLLMGLFGVAMQAKSSPVEVLTKLLNRKHEFNDCIVFISSGSDKITDIYHLYGQIRTIYKSRRLFYDCDVVTFEDVQNRTQEGTINLKEIRNILQGIGSGNAKLIMEQFDSIRDYIAGNKNFSIDYIEGIYINLCLETYKSYYNLQISRSNRDVLDKLLNANSLIESTRSLSEMHSSIRGLILDFMRLYGEYKKADVSNDMIEAARKYIEENYHNPNISLQSVSEKLGMNNSYLSTQFKKETGLSFNDYLTSIRVSKAIDFMQQKNLSILDIGRKVGYVSDKHFFVVFKKHTGMTPAKFRSKAAIE
jgi:two-component system, response regulator YesN